MKILLIYNRYVFRGGEDTYVDSLEKLLKDNGHVVIPYYKDSSLIVSTLDKIKASIGLFWNSSVASEIDTLINTHKPDVAHIHNIYPLISPTIYYVLKRKGIRIVQTIHNYKFVCPKNSLFRNNKVCELCVNKVVSYPAIIFGCYHNSHFSSLIYSISFFLHHSLGAFYKIDKFIFPSLFTRDYYIKHAHIFPKKTVFLPHFVNNIPKSLSTNTSSSYFLFVGRLSEEKGIQNLLNIFSQLNNQRLVVIGDGALRQMLLKKHSQYKNIQFINHVDNHLVLSYMRKSLAIIVPSLWYEVLPMVILEAIMCNKPLYVRKTKNTSRMLFGIKGIVLYDDSSLVSLLRDVKNIKKIVNYDKIQTILSPDHHLHALLKIYSSK